MCPDRYTLLRCNNKGIGLVTVIFAIIILATFGLLIARYTTISQVSSAEDYVWAQALYSAQSGAQLRILDRDGGGGVLAVPPYPTIGQCTITTVTDAGAVGDPSTLRLKANKGDIERTIEIKYKL
ncbi:hypothetical protein ACFL6N_06400 [Thermodesulfobacteriota bacterium]